MRALTRAIAGRDVPKQFRAMLGRDTLLRMTPRRVRFALDPARTLTVVTRAHERFFSPMMAELPHCRLLVQPRNRGTATALAYAAFHLAELDHSASVAIFPSDHWFSDDAGFMRNVEMAFETVAQFQDSTVALGLAAERPEAGYGWFELGERVVTRPAALFEVRRFWEKPPLQVTRELWRRGAQRNSFVLVSKLSALLDLIREALPQLYRAFYTVRPALATLFEERTVESLYEDLASLDFSERCWRARRKTWRCFR